MSLGELARAAFKYVYDYAVWEFGGAALMVLGRSLFSGSSKSSSAANGPGMILTPNGWELDNRRPKTAGAIFSPHSEKQNNRAAVYAAIE